MPQLGVVIELLSLAAAGAGIGMEVAGVGRPSSGDATKQLRQAQEQQAQQAAQQRQKAILANLANAQEQGGGALGNPSLVELASVIAGLPGEGQASAGRSALASYLGTPSTTMTGTTGGLPFGDTMMGATGAVTGLSGAQQS